MQLPSHNSGGGGGGKLFAVGLGNLLGALIGSAIGRDLDKLDRIKMQQTAERAIEKSSDNKSDNKPVTWNNPNTGNSGVTVATKTYNTNLGKP